MGTVKLILSPQHHAPVGVNDTNGERTIVFASSFETAGPHAGTMDDLTNAVQLSYVESVSPATDLIDGAIYTARLEYRDSVNNPSAGEDHTEIHYAGTSTITPTLSHPLLGRPAKHGAPLIKMPRFP